MAGFYSYIPLLAKYLRIIAPKRVLEWGPGESTRIIQQLCPDAQIVTIENNPAYAGSGIILLSTKEAYVSYPLGLGKKFDFIFVDGFDDWRPDCLDVAHEVVADDGVVLLHDSERSWYREAVEKFCILEENDGTVVLKK